MTSFDMSVSGSFDISSSIDMDQDARRAAVERDTAAKLRETIAKMGGEQIMDPRAFVSTDKQRLLTAGLFASCAALVLRGAYGVQMGEDGADPLQWTELFGSMAAAYWLSDIGTGIFHWSVDNYGDKNTPLMGSIIDAFQGHHKYPWTITKRQFANNIHVTCPATMCVTVPLLLTPGMDQNACAFMGTFCAMIVLSQQFHAWSHMKKSQLPELVVRAQDAGLFISRKNHGGHHRPPFRGNYCIVSGWWNELLDGSGFFTRLEKTIYAATGVAPRCWSEKNDFKVQEEAPEGWGEGIL
jgi:ubiquitin-conjugating enzyme E2 variant